MLPEVGVNRHAGNLDFGGGYVSPAQLGFDLRSGHQIPVYLRADPGGMGIIIRDHRNERRFKGRIQPF
ncbi:hypothetical protein D3C80_2176440 [compost metagenome]